MVGIEPVVRPGVFLSGRYLYNGRDLYRAVQCIVDLFPSIFKVYLPIHTVPMLLFRFRKLRLKDFVAAGLNTLRSTTFLSSFVAVFAYVLAKLRNMRQKDVTADAVFAGAICAIAVEIEKPARRTELAVYCVPRTLEILYALAGLPYLRLGDHLIFVVALALLMGVYHGSNKAAVKRTYASILDGIFGFNYSTNPPREQGAEKNRMSKSGAGGHGHDDE